jgi:hypothetical protein
MSGRHSIVKPPVFVAMLCTTPNALTFSFWIADVPAPAVSKTLLAWI